VDHLLPGHQKLGRDLLVIAALGGRQHNLCPSLDRRQIWRNHQGIENRTFRGGNCHAFIIPEPGKMSLPRAG
jgi:hypothetical protein